MNIKLISELALSHLRIADETNGDDSANSVLLEIETAITSLSAMTTSDSDRAIFLALETACTNNLSVRMALNAFMAEHGISVQTTTRQQFAERFVTGKSLGTSHAKLLLALYGVSDISDSALAVALNISKRQLNGVLGSGGRLVARTHGYYDHAGKNRFQRGFGTLIHISDVNGKKTYALREATRQAVSDNYDHLTQLATDN